MPQRSSADKGLMHGVAVAEINYQGRWCARHLRQRQGYSSSSGRPSSHEDIVNHMRKGEQPPPPLGCTHLRHAAAVAARVSVKTPILRHWPSRAPLLLPVPPSMLSASDELSNGITV